MTANLRRSFLKTTGFKRIFPMIEVKLINMSEIGENCQIVLNLPRSTLFLHENLQTVSYLMGIFDNQTLAMEVIRS